MVLDHRRFAAAATLLLVFAACESPQAAAPERPGDIPEERRIVLSEWDRKTLVGGVEGDSALISPHRLNVSADGVYLVDFYPRRVHRYDHSGKLLWRFGRDGSGPNEFRQPLDMKVDAAGQAWVLDPTNARVTVIAKDGSGLRHTSVKDLGRYPGELLPMDGGQALLVTDDPREPFVVIDSAGRMEARHRFPSPEFSQLHHLSSQLITGRDPASGRWAAAFRLGDGFLSFRGDRWEGWRGWFVEEVPFPEIVTERSGRGTRTRHKEKPVSAARSLTLSPEYLYVLFGGTSRDRNRIVDSYSLRTGAYKGSYLLPEKVLEIAWYDGGLYAIRDDPHPELAYLKPAGGQRLP